MSEATKDDPRGRHAHGHAPPPGGMAALALAALGVVFGDIGTSPLYAMKECFTGHHAVRPDEQGVLGVLSLMFWSLTSVVAVKYIAFIMRADNDGEGGILALLALVPEPSRKREGAGTPLVLLVLFGAALLYGDGVITPAISVLSAVEGLEVATVALKPVVVPTTVVILIALFLVQRRGTAGIGAVFGPVMIAWFVALAGLGVVQIAKNPAIFAALNPVYAVGYLVHHGYHGFLVLGSVVLCVTGGEALYADMGHFGARSIRLAWFFIVMPSLVLNYFGQGALVLADPKAAEQPFFAMVPRWGLYPMVALATAATVIASQALISGAFSLTRQAVQLGFCPRVTIVHTSKDQEGQIYIPEINTALMVSCIVLVLAFKESSKLAAAYGIAVTGTMAITSIVYYVVVTRTWGWAWWKAAPLVLGFLVFDGGFLAANIVKIADGGWVPLAMGLCVFTAMTTWKAGRKRLAQQIATASTSLDEFLGRVDAAPPPRVPGTAVFMTASPTGVSPVLLHHYRHNQVLHEQVVLLTILSEDVPFVSPKKRIRVEPLAHGFYRIKSSFGFMETPRIPAILEACAIFGLTIDPETVTFYVGRETLIASSRPGMARWRKGLFSFLSRNARTATAYFGIPPDRVVELGMQVELLPNADRGAVVPGRRGATSSARRRRGAGARRAGGGDRSRGPRLGAVRHRGGEPGARGARARRAVGARRARARRLARGVAARAGGADGLGAVGIPGPRGGLLRRREQPPVARRRERSWDAHPALGRVDPRRARGGRPRRGRRAAGALHRPRGRRRG